MRNLVNAHMVMMFSLCQMQKCRALDDSVVPPLLDGAISLEFLNLTDCQSLHSPKVASERLIALHLYNCLQEISWNQARDPRIPTRCAILPLRSYIGSQSSVLGSKQSI